MNLKRLKEVEREFLKRYPGGFDNPEMVEVGKKHKMGKMVDLVQGSFGKAKFNDPDEIISKMIKTVTSSSMVSVFEKPRFRDTVREMSVSEKKTLAVGLKSLLHGNQKRGFEKILEVLKKYKMAKWTLMTVIPAYYRKDKEVFIKPTTTKNIINKLELDLTYNATPSWEFYEAYREIINRLKKKVSKRLSPSNAAFCGFLMMSLDKEMQASPGDR